MVKPVGRDGREIDKVFKTGGSEEGTICKMVKPESAVNLEIGKMVKR